MDPIAIYKMQMQAANLTKGEAVELVADWPPSGSPIRKTSKRLDGLMDESPPLSPATLKRRESKEQAKKLEQGDVFAGLGIPKDGDTLYVEAKKRELLEKTAAKFLALARRSAAEASSTRWRTVAQLYKAGKLSLSHWKSIEDREASQKKTDSSDVFATFAPMCLA